MSALALTLIAATATAFDGEEHRAVSNDALMRAKAHVLLDHPELERSNMQSEIARLLPSASHDHTFGDVTKIVDWFQEPDRFASTQDWGEIEKRTSQLVQRGLALHKNGAHFQAQAAGRYALLHDCAISEAQAQHAATALWCEAFALHYLHDFFAPGHVVTPRSGSHDAVSAALHDKFNANGLLVDVVAAQMNELGKGLGAPWRAKDPIRFLGDGRLDGDQYEFLVIVSARSISDVLDAYITRTKPAPSLQLCFWSRSAETDPKTKRIDARTFQGPYASLRRPTPHDQESCRCEENAIATYHIVDFTDNQSLDMYSLDLRALKASAYGGILPGRSRYTLDLGGYLNAWDPPGTIRKRLNKDDNCPPDTFKDTLSGGALFTATAVKGNGYRALGMAIEVDESLADPANPKPSWRDNIYLIGYLARRRYWSENRHTNAVDIGGKVSLGFNIVNVVLVAERGHDFTDRDFQARYFVMAGAEFVVPRSWLGLMTRAILPKPPRMIPSTPRSAGSSLRAAAPSR